jgi:aminomethyltransferase
MAETMTALRKTALNATHRAHRAKMVDFGGWDMPVEYSGLIAEHMAVRTGVGLFDVSHMGDIQFRGPGSLAAVQRLCMNDASKLAVGQAHYSAMLYPDGSFVDDVVVHKLGDNDYLLVINAGTRDKDIAWVRKQVGAMPGIHINDYSDFYTQLAIQGPSAEATLQKLTDTDLSTIKNYWFTWGKLALQEGPALYNVLIARTGYTGEDGFEMMLPAGHAVDAWLALNALGVVSCGLGARDTLRLEAGMNLYGNDMDESTHPFESGLGWTVALEPAERRFIGREALQRVKAAGSARELIGLVLEDRGVLRSHQKVIAPGGTGEITSGTFSPTLERSIAFARIPSGPVARVEVDIRGKLLAARRVKPPFVRAGKALVS